MTLFSFRIGGRYRIRTGRAARCICVDRVGVQPDMSNVCLVEGPESHGNPGESCFFYNPEGKNHLGCSEYDIVEELSSSDDPQVGDLVYVSDSLPIRADGEKRKLLATVGGWFICRIVDSSGQEIDPKGMPTPWRYAAKSATVVYRRAEMPKDWGKWCEFSNSPDFSNRHQGRLCGFRPPSGWLSQSGEHKYARIKEGT